jgi:hypothetical protein
MKIESGQVWESVGSEFRVIDVVDIDDHTWIHYKNQQTGQEHSCYQESFESRFIPILNRS